MEVEAIVIHWVHLIHRSGYVRGARYQRYRVILSLSFIKRKTRIEWRDSANSALPECSFSEFLY